MTESKSTDNLSDAGGEDQQPDVEQQRDYGCEIISAVVILSLSALSHFWLLAIAAGALLAMWSFAVMTMRVWNLASSRVEFRRNAAAVSPSGPQVFLPEKIRPSVDC